MRDPRIDFLRFLGLSLIILAHVDPPNWLFQLRNFDVPLMVIVAGLSFSKAAPLESYVGYLWKRVRRLLIPLWLFLSLYFGVLHWLWPTHEWLALENVVASYGLLGIVGVPYVWIIRVFLLVAAIAPGIAWLNAKVRRNQTYLLLLAGAYSCYELLVAVSLNASEASPLGKLLALVFYYGIAFSIIFALGVRLPRLTQGQLQALLVTSLGLFLALGMAGKGFGVVSQSQVLPDLQAFKYPPTAYYLSYAVAVGAALWLSIDFIMAGLKRLKPLENFILFSSRNSMWLYLWHIPFVEAFRALDYSNIGVKYVVAFGCASLVTLVQSKLIRLALMPKLKNELIRRNVKLILTG